MDERIYQNAPYDLRSPFTKVVLLARTGSVSQNTDLDDGNDGDVEGIIFPPLVDMLGSKPWSQWFESSKTLDVKLYSPKRYVELLSNLNPSTLSLLWLRSEDIYEMGVEYVQLRDFRDDLTCLRAFEALHGYAFSQLQAMRKSIGGKVQPSRLPLVEKYGYDTKFACHAIRGMEMAVEYAWSGELNVFRPNGWRLRDIRRGQLTSDEIEEWFADIESSLKAARVAAIALYPARPNMKRIESWLVDNSSLWVNEYEVRCMIGRMAA